jgi:hypothetical protein
MTRSAGRISGEAGRGGRAGRGRGGARVGASPVPVAARGTNYNKTALKRAVDDIRRTGPIQWKQVALRYKELSGEDALREGKGLRKAWIERSCSKTFRSMLFLILCLLKNKFSKQVLKTIRQPSDTNNGSSTYKYAKTI